MMKKHLLKAFAVAALSLVNIYAMAAPISGHVQDANGEPLIGVSVSIEGTSEGTITDIDGNYAIAEGKVMGDASTYAKDYSNYIMVSTKGIRPQPDKKFYLTPLPSDQVIFYEKHGYELKQNAGY